MESERSPLPVVWTALFVVAVTLSVLFVPDALSRYQRRQAVEHMLPTWRQSVEDYVRCVDPDAGEKGVTAQGLLWTRLQKGQLPAQLHACSRQHLSQASVLDEGLASEGAEGGLARAARQIQRVIAARRRDHGSERAGVDDRAIRDTCTRLAALTDALGAVEAALDISPTFAASDCTLALPELAGLRPPSSARGQQLLDLQVRDAHVIAQLRPQEGGTRFLTAALGTHPANSAPGDVQWQETQPMPALADGRDYAWDAARGLWTVGFDPTSKRWRAYKWQGAWRSGPWLPAGFTPDRVDWTGDADQATLVARSGPTDSSLFRLQGERLLGPTPFRRVERFDPMTHIGRSGSVTTVDLEFPAAGPHLSVSHSPGSGSDLSQAFLPLPDARTQWFVQPHLVGCSHQRRHWAVAGSRWLTPTATGGDGRWWVATSGDDGATWQVVAKTPKAWQLFTPVLACRGDTLVNVTVSRAKGESRTVYVECSPTECAAPVALATPPARHIGLHWRAQTLSILAGFRAHAALFLLQGKPLIADRKGTYRRLPVRSGWDTVTHLNGRWFDLNTVDPLPW